MEAGTQNLRDKTLAAEDVAKSRVEYVGEGEEFANAADPSAGAVKRVAGGSEDPEDLADATAWFLSDDPTPPAVKTFGLNVGKWSETKGEYEDFVIDWTVSAIARERIRQIRKLAMPARARATGGEPDDTKANAQIAAEGSVKPNVKQIAANLGTQDLGEVMRRRFAHKPGLIDQIAGEVLTVSGYDDDDVRDPSTVRD